MRRGASLFAIGLAAACLRAPGYTCDDDAQCVRKAGGSCVGGACAYPDSTCASELRWDSLAPQEHAGECVGEGGSSDGGDEPPAVRCGNGVVEELEDCDDHNTVGGDACPALCVGPGTMLWQVTWDGPAHSEDKGYGIVIDEAGASFYVAGFATEEVDEGQDILLQKRWIEDGSLRWSRTARSDGRGNDNGENVALDLDGNPVIVGVAIGEATDGDLFVRKYDPDGNELWSWVHDEQGLFDRAQGVGVTSTGGIVVVGNVSVMRDAGAFDSEVWMQPFAADGTPMGAPIVRGTVGLDDEAVDADGDADGWLVTGRVEGQTGELGVWTARYDRDGMLRWEESAGMDPLGYEQRGVGMGLDPMGGSATAGVLADDIWVRRYDAFGTPGWTFTLNGPQSLHDEAADVGFAADGSYVVVGFVDFATDGFASADTWVRVFEPDGTERWTDVYDGPAHEIDKALAVTVDSKGSALVTGYQTVPGQARDVWMRRYAM
jgi:cysteine-rich repeat protein